MRVSLDVRGDICPVPLLKTKKKLEELKSGDILEVTIDHEPSIRTISMMAKKKGYGVEVEEKRPDYVVKVTVK